ncbi:homoserine dehydrogenase [Natrarchaeobius chitinivorans]|uniref:homoserine dehydrogenase n=1 Tax=Natrarchaeobius chitinivorans TaxID=1679083 RepID=A0A3N6LZX1_NATCH|nr:homoserine dehydrogenase [Natrarchaeobius chitinivorans]RQG93524.1 homoserine dehydrogenase [Natrarchaeobius chitinivorans]
MRLVVIGTGSVGRSIAELAADYGHEIVGLADSAGAVIAEDGVDVADAFETKAADGTVGSADPADVFETSYDVLVEATTTVDDANPGFENAREALARDRDVVLANRDPVAKRFDELRELERNSDGTVKFGATVGGSLPIISILTDHRPSNIVSVRGVLNDTSNFILSRMAAEKLDYEHVLTEAKELGIADEDPSADVNGTDTAVKCTILSNMLSSYDESAIDDSITVDDVDTDGITNIPGSLLELAAQDSRTIRLIGEVNGNGVRVGPRLVPDDSPLAAEGAQNIVQIETTHSGTITLSGQGMDDHGTASAVFTDIDRL